MVHEDELPGQEDLRTLLGDAKLRFGFWHPLYCRGATLCQMKLNCLFLLY